MLKLNLELQKIGQPVTQGVSYSGLMNQRIRKSTSFLQPLYEAFSNSLEAVEDSDYCIEVDLFHSKSPNIFGDSFGFVSLQITDYGQGFTNESFSRFSTLFDCSKNKNNLGTGRIQFLHSFKYTQIDSIYIGEDSKKYQRKVLMSLSFDNNKGNVIYACDPIVVDNKERVRTVIAFFNPLHSDDKEKLDHLTCNDIKDSLLKRYLNKLCIEKEKISAFKINHFVNEVYDKDQSTEITSEDIPSPIYQDTLEIPYSIFDEGTKRVIHTAQTEEFSICGFELPLSYLAKNEVRLTSKGEAFTVPGCDFSLITETPRITPGKSILFLLSSNYLTNRDSDVRGNLQLYSKTDFISKRNLFTGKQEILIDDIENY